MATYIPNAEDITEPVESRTVESAAREFRTLKAYIQNFDSQFQDILDAIENIGSGGVPGFLYVQRESGNDSTTAYTLDFAPASGAAVDAYINGLRQQHNTFTVVGDLLTFNEPPPAGVDNIEFVVNVTTAVGTQGPQGDPGPQGAPGPAGVAGPAGADGVDGADGRGIVSVIRTAGTGAAGTTDTYTITYTDATTSTFFVYNGADGLGSGDMLKSVYDADNDGKVDAAEVADAAPWAGITGKPATFPPDAHTHTANQISDATTVGKAVLTAADAAAARTAIGAPAATSGTMSDPTLTGAVYQNGSVRGNIVAMGALGIDCSAGNYFTKTINANSTFTVSNVPASRAFAFTLELTHTSGTITWFSGIQWPNGLAPSLTIAKVHLFVFVTDDGGTRWRGVANTNYTN